MYESIGATTMGLPPATAGGIESWLGTLCEHGWNLLARRTGRVVGHISVAPADATAPEIVVFVHDDYHGHGIGTELVKQAIARAEDHGHESLTLTVDPGNRAAVSIYCDTGFEVESADVSLEMRLPMHKPVVEAVQRPPADR
jgi:putative acetyltransferase